jgi:hypothetical protein
MLAPLLLLGTLLCTLLLVTSVSGMPPVPAVALLSVPDTLPLAALGPDQRVVELGAEGPAGSLDSATASHARTDHVPPTASLARIQPRPVRSVPDRLRALRERRAPDLTPSLPPLAMQRKSSRRVRGQSIQLGMTPNL